MNCIGRQYGIITFVINVTYLYKFTIHYIGFLAHCQKYRRCAEPIGHYVLYIIWRKKSTVFFLHARFSVLYTKNKKSPFVELFVVNYWP